MLDERKLKFIDLLIEGKTNKTDISILVGVSRKCLYDWLEDSEVQAELDRRLQAIKTQGEKKIMSQLEPVVDELFRIALTAPNARERKDACIYLCNRVLGTPASTTHVVSEDVKDENIDILAAFEEAIERERAEDRDYTAE